MKPDHVYDFYNWEGTYAWGDRDLLLDGAPTDGTIFQFATLIDGPDKFAIYIVTKRDADGDEIEGEWRWFDSEDEARAAREAPP